MYKMLKINAETYAKNCIHNTREDIIIPITVSTPGAFEFKIRLGFNQHELIMAKEQSVLTKIM